MKSMSMYEKQAKLIVKYAVEVQKDDSVLIQGPAIAEPLIKEIYQQVLISGGHPILNLGLKDLQTIFFRFAKDHQLDHPSPYKKFLVEHIDCLIAILGAYNTRELTNIIPEKLARVSQANKEIAEIHSKRAASGDLRWNLSPFATSAQAQEASMSRLEYEDMILKTLFLDKDDPIKEWQSLSAVQQQYVEFLNGTEEIHILGEDIDLKLSVKGRTWINSDGKHNLPSGEVFTSPVEDSIVGHIRFKYPGIYSGQEIEDIQLILDEGKVTKASALKGEELLQTIIKTDPGAQQIGEIGIGTNSGVTQLTRNMLFDEKMSGTIHLALGRSFPETGGMNKSTIHWDILAQPEEMYADGTLFWKNGKFIIS